MVDPILSSLAIPILIQHVSKCFRNIDSSCGVLPSWSLWGSVTHHVWKYNRVSSMSLLFPHQLGVLVLATVSIRIANSIPSPQSNRTQFHPPSFLPSQQRLLLRLEMPIWAQKTLIALEPNFSWADPLFGLILLSHYSSQPLVLACSCGLANYAALYTEQKFCLISFCWINIVGPSTNDHHYSAS